MSKQSTPLQKWEYTVVDYLGEDTKSGLSVFTKEAVNSVLNNTGNDGWELVSVDSSPHKMRFFFKRMK